MQIVRATNDHANELADNLREADARELGALGVTPSEALVESVQSSSHAWAWLGDDGRVIAMFGVAPVSILSDTAIVWLLGSPSVDRHAVTFMRICRAYLDYISPTYPRLINYVDARYVRAVAWLRRLGFEVADAEPLGPNGVLFHRLEKRV